MNRFMTFLLGNIFFSYSNPVSSFIGFETQLKIMPKACQTLNIKPLQNLKQKDAAEYNGHHGSPKIPFSLTSIECFRELSAKMSLER